MIKKAPKGFKKEIRESISGLNKIRKEIGCLADRLGHEYNFEDLLSMLEEHTYDLEYTLLLDHEWEITVTDEN